MISTPGCDEEVGVTVVVIVSCANALTPTRLFQSQGLGHIAKLSTTIVVVIDERGSAAGSLDYKLLGLVTSIRDSLRETRLRRDVLKSDGLLGSCRDQEQ